MLEGGDVFGFAEDVGVGLQGRVRVGVAEPRPATREWHSVSGEHEIVAAQHAGDPDAVSTTIEIPRGVISAMTPTIG